MVCWWRADPLWPPGMRGGGPASFFFPHLFGPGFSGWQAGRHVLRCSDSSPQNSLDPDMAMVRGLRSCQQGAMEQWPRWPWRHSHRRAGGAVVAVAAKKRGGSAALTVFLFFWSDGGEQEEKNIKVRAMAFVLWRASKSIFQVGGSFLLCLMRPVCARGRRQV